MQFSVLLYIPKNVIDLGFQMVTFNDNLSSHWSQRNLT